MVLEHHCDPGRLLGSCRNTVETLIRVKMRVYCIQCAGGMLKCVVPYWRSNVNRVNLHLNLISLRIWWFEHI